MRVIAVLWDFLFAFGGWYLYRNPRLFEGEKTEPGQIRINRVGGIALMIFGVGCAVASLVQGLVKTSR